MLESIEKLFWKPLSFDLLQIDDAYADYDDEETRIHTIVLFDIKSVDEEELELFFEDTFCDGIPEGVNFEVHIPFALVGDCDENIEEGALSEIIQPGHMLLLDLANSEDGKTPVLMIEIDGSAVDGAPKKVANDLSELKFGKTRVA